MQLVFLALNVVLCAEFVLFVQKFEGFRASFDVARPPGVEGWLCPVGTVSEYLYAVGGISAAAIADFLDSPILERVYRELIPKASEFAQP